MLTPALQAAISTASAPHLVKTTQPAEQQQCRRRFRNTRRRRRRAINHDVVDAIRSRRRRCAIEHYAKRRVRIVIQSGNTHERKNERQRAKRSRRHIWSSEVDEVDAIETVLKLITIESRARSLRRKTHDDVCKP